MGGMGRLTGLHHTIKMFVLVLSHALMTETVNNAETPKSLCCAINLCVFYLIFYGEASDSPM